jgi:hypothetical protein
VHIEGVVEVFMGKCEAEVVGVLWNRRVVVACGVAGGALL